MTRLSSKSRKPSKAPKPISDEEVARFLKHLAVGYRDKRTGNPLLADALSRIAGKILNSDVGNTSAQNVEVPNGDQEQLAFDTHVGSFEVMNVESVSQFLEDPTKTKSQIIELAASRFGMPKSKLLRLPLNLVREAVRSALMHEGSLAVITEEAARYGSRRRS